MTKEIVLCPRCWSHQTYEVEELKNGWKELTYSCGHTIKIRPKVKMPKRLLHTYREVLEKRLERGK